MASVHTVAQGETLIRIAKQYNYNDPDLIYNHESNAEFRELRPDPNIIFPGDQINIPDKEKLVRGGFTGYTHVFKVKKPPVEVFRMQITNKAGEPWAGKRILLNIGGETIDAPIGDDGMIEVELTGGDESGGNLEVYMDPNSEEPTHVYEIQMGSLDPVEELSGVQARCNLLGFECGVADGINGSNTERGVKEFQAAHGLDVDGIAGPMTKAKLKDVYGC